MLEAATVNQFLSTRGMDDRAISAPATALTIKEARHLVEEMAKSEAWRMVDEIDMRLEADPDSYYALTTNHIFTPGLYVREVVMRAGHFVTTRIHLTKHPYIISAGRALVWTDDQGVIEVGAPFSGVTKPGTRRLLFILEDTIWSTMHANPDNETDPDKIVASVTYNNRLLREKTRTTP